MKYIEELSYGDTFTFNDEVFVLTCNFKNNGTRLCVGLTTGNPKWFAASEMIRIEPIYVLDADNNTVPVKQTKKNESIKTIP